MTLGRWMILTAAAAADGRGGRRRRRKKENKCDLSHKRIWEVGLVVLMASAMMESLLVKAELLCEVDELKHDARCEATGSNDSLCSISPYEGDECYFTFFECWMQDITFIPHTRIINGQFFTDIVISNLSETSWSVVIWTVDPQGWWFVDVKDSYEVSVLGLPGNISSKEPPKLFDAPGCLGCPPPIFRWYTDPERHLLRFLVENDTKHGFTPSTEVQFLLFSSNETNFSRSCDRRENHCANITGHVGELIGVPDVYSTEFCVQFTLPPIKENGAIRQYYCGRKIDMTEYPDVPIHGEILIPLWMKVISAVVILLMVSIVIFLIGTVKGWITVPVRHRICRKRPVPSVSVACDSSSVPDVERKQEFTSTIEEQTQFLKTNDRGPVVDVQEAYS